MSEQVLFAFDDHAFPFRRGLRLRLHSFPGEADDRPTKVLEKGAPGEADSESVAYYGSVISVGPELWMYYLGNDTPGEGRHQRLMLARSTDGRSWTKPSLGVVEYGGNSDNNICDLPVDGHLQAAVVLYEPHDPDPDRRFKLSFETELYDKRMAVAFSADGVTWVPYEANPVGPYFFEQSGGIRRHGAYLVNGQGATEHWAAAGFARQLVTHVSYDFVNWSQEGVLGFARDDLPPRPTTHGGIDGRQVHLGAALWDRGDTVIGFYGMWNGHPSNDRRLITMDIGLLVSHDALHFTEPIPDFPIVSGRETKTTIDHSAFPQLMQGQGFANIGDHTLFWYSAWPESDADAVLLATWKRDRLGHLEAYRGPEPAVAMSRVLVAGADDEIVLNAELVSEFAELRVELVDEQFAPLEGYTAADASLSRVTDLESTVTWAVGRLPDTPFRLRIHFAGPRPEDVHLFAAYVRSAR
ncbi:hypothetical protein [Microbacterium sp. SSM24]|uniref:hypothetical protein n=1 Tax=Microbacterium sp. SSM24 TaxID=2991714 RepID=UPI0022265185|nr:hypothetical protein [Microbacterium sp. SSM24]MCW3492580.1 hypothetical protein [Microbacterium sp. SSM24]